MLSQKALMALAREGAALRYKELVAEVAQLLEWFPDLRKESAPVQKIVRPSKVITVPKPKSKSGRKSMSPEERAKVGRRMKRYWANRRREATGYEKPDPPRRKVGSAKK